MLGAAVLFASGIIVKIIGAVYKIPLSNLFGKEGLGYFYVAYNIYAALYVISSSGLPAAVSKLVAESAARGDYCGANKIFRVSLLWFSLFGAAISAALVIFARGFAAAVGNSRAYCALAAVAPAIFFSAVISSVRGYYQGLNDMTPTAVSQVIEAAIKLALGVAVAKYMLGAGYRLEIAAAGAIFGVTAGSALSAVYLIMLYICENGKKRCKADKHYSKQNIGSRAVFGRIIKIVIPITLGASVSSIAGLIDIAMVMRRMQQTGFDERAANALYGAYNMALTVFNLPQTLITAIGITVIPAIAAEYSRGDICRAGKNAAAAVRMTMLAAFPCAAGFAALAEPVMRFIYFGKAEDAAAAAPMLAVLSAGVIFVSAVSATNAVLQAAGRVNVPVFAMLAGAAAKVAAGYVLMGDPKINAAGAAFSTVICYAVAAAINVGYIIKRTELRIDFAKACISPLAASMCMGVFAFAANSRLGAVIDPKLALILTVCAAIPVYFICIRLTGGLEKEDVLMLPGGRRIAGILKI